MEMFDNFHHVSSARACKEVLLDPGKSCLLDFCDKVSVNRFRQDGFLSTFYLFKKCYHQHLGLLIDFCLLYVRNF